MSRANRKPKVAAKVVERPKPISPPKPGVKPATPTKTAKLVAALKLLHPMD